MNFLKKILFGTIVFIAYLQVTVTFAGLPPAGLIPEDNKIDGLGTGSDGIVTGVVEYLRSSIFGLLPLIAIAVFLYVGFKLVVARGNPEDFKKAWITFIYAIIGIFVVSFAWVAVKLISGLDI